MVLLAFLVRIRLREDSRRFPKTLFNDWSFFQGFFRIVVESYGSPVRFPYVNGGSISGSCRFA